MCLYILFLLGLFLQQLHVTANEYLLQPHGAHYTMSSKSLSLSVALPIILLYYSLPVGGTRLSQLVIVGCERELIFSPPYRCAVYC